MSRYLLINLLTVLFPVILSFEKKISFYKKFKYLLFSILTVSPFYLVWDAVATSRGDWGFSPEYLIEIYIFGLPLEEVLFFVTVPYSCIFIFETVKLYIPEKKTPFRQKLLLSGRCYFNCCCRIFQFTVLHFDSNGILGDFSFSCSHI
ncbi:MAG: lycopene cyclase domain-containing protein [Ignavibacteriales bacterium]|nr:lycopene cyclase domain-containing protein [Ignavibacteriales bacterium]